MRLSFPSHIKPSKNWLIFGAAIGFGLLAAAIAYGILNSQMAAIEAKSRGEMVAVVVAKQDLNKGTRLTPDTVAVRNVPRDYAHSVAITPEQFETVYGQGLAFPVKAGEMVLWGLVEGRRAPTFSARVGSGRRAMTVPVDEINSISGMLEPGDLIDLIVTLDQKSKKVSLPLMQRVQVMATGQRSVDDPKSGERKSYSTLTLDTTPEQAQNIIMAREAGKLSALLRNPEDKQLLPVDEAALAALLGRSAGGRASPGPGREVPVLYGGTARLSADALNLPQPTAQPQPQPQPQPQHRSQQRLESAAVAGTGRDGPQGDARDAPRKEVPPQTLPPAGSPHRDEPPPH